ncbi:MAG: RHS repeat-associated core domain-containing protein [Breznakibacter sp.]
MNARPHTGHAVAVLLIALVMPLTGYAQSQKKTSTPDWENWTEEQLSQWEDSVLKALYPFPEINRSPIAADSAKSIAAYNTSLDNQVEQSLLISTQAITIDQSKGVGEIPIIPGISPTGSSTYQVPVNVYPGPNGIQPQLALVYNSNGGNGTLGMGWGLSGISKITRINKSVYYDGKPDGVNRTSDDAFALDGMRLIKTSSTGNTINYESEQGQIKAIAYLAGSIVSYFRVLYPNGSKGIYGHTDNTDSQDLEYPLMEMTDLQGNMVNYSYSWFYRNYVSRITYGDNGGASVVFEYDTTRPDPFTIYQGGLQLYENRRLIKIHCKYGNSVLRTYEISYKTEKSNSVISQINCTAGGKAFNPLMFNYGTGNSQTSYSRNDVQLLEWYNAGDSPSSIRITKGKFDYGADDDGVISLPNKNPYWNHYRNSTAFRHSQNRYDNKYAGDEKIFLYAGLADSWASPMPNLTTEAGFVDIFCANVDGKYEEEVIKVNNKVNGSNDELTFKVYTASLYTGLAQKYTRTYNFSTVLTDADGGKSIHPKFYFSGDFSGKGKTEILAVSCHNPLGKSDITSKCYLFDLESNTKLYEGYVFPYIVDFVGVRQTDPDAAFNNTDRLFVMDYNGDGKSDICLINDSGTNIYTFDVAGSSYTMRKVATYTGLKKSNLAGRSLMPGEFDSDGLIDLLVSPATSGGSSWSIYHSLGNGQFNLTTFAGTSISTDENNGVMLQDLNGDGLTDLIKYSSSGFFTYITQNGTPSYASSYTTHPTYAKLIPTNINSRNVFSQLLSIKDGIVTKYLFPRDDTRERMLSSAVNSLGVEYRNNYQKLNSSAYNASGSVYTKGYGATFPYENFNGPMWALSTQEVWQNELKQESVSYNYQNAVIHRQGLGFRGFEKMTGYDNVRGRSFAQEIDPYNYMIPKTDESPTGKNTYQYSVSVQTNKILKLQLTGKTNFNKPANTSTSSVYTYDTYGNVTKEVVTYTGNITVTTDNKFSNSTSETTYFLGFLHDQTVTTNRNGASSYSRFLYPVYSNGRPNVKVYLTDGQTVKQETFRYDGLGKIKTKTETRFSSPTLTTTYSYDAYGHLIGTTDPMGFTAEIHYAANGLPDYTKNHKGQQTILAYDEFGRQKTVTDPLGLVTETSYSWDATGTNGLYCITQTTTGQPIQKAWYDAFGREVRQAVQRFDGLWAQTDKLYDSYGRLQKVSQPFTGSNASFWHTYSYDSHDRLLSVAQASGKRTTYSYNGLQTTTTDDGIATTRTFDALGKLVKAVDPGGVIVYSLRPDGQPSAIEASGGITTTFTYDLAGRQLSITDPSAGTTSYGYDSAGNLNKQVDAEGRETTMVYDNYGRMTSKNTPELSTTYTYNTDGLLTAAASNNGTSTTYTYDTYFRATSEKETGADGLWIEKTYSYNTDGNAEKLTYTTHDGTVASEHYAYSYGRLTEIKLNGTTSIFKLTAQNALGQPTAVTTGPIARQYTYDNYGTPTGRAAGSLMDAAYSFDAATGNLLSRKDQKRNLTETFGYDQLNRLTNYGKYMAIYDIKGNLAGKSDVGTFYYANGNKPYAMSGAAPITNTIPLRSQTITYNSFEQPATISENGYLASFSYNTQGQRVKMEVTQNGAAHLVRHYLGACYEKDQGIAGTKEKLYLGGDAYTAPAVYVKQDGSWQLYYVCRDHLGSTTHLASDSGALAQELSFDAWGRLRNPATQTAYASGSEPELFLGRGYTGHEHLPWFGLVNMNGRLYDPALGRFLSPDNYVQLPDFTQSYNRYGYCWNNPLKYTDPTGEYAIVDDIIAAAVGGIINLASNAIQGNIHSFGQGLAAFGAGAVGGIGAIYPEFGGWVWGGATVGATNAWLGGARSAGDIAMGAGVGVVSSVTGGMAGQWAVNTASPLLSSISSPVLRGATTGVIGGAAGGYVGGFTGGLIMTGDLSQASSAGFNGMWMGAGIGGVTGGGYGYKYAVENNLNPWTGRSTLELLTPLKPIEGYVSPNQKGQEGVNRAIEEINAQGGKVLRQEVTLEVNGVRVRVDIAADFNGQITLIEVKNGPSAGFTPNQRIVYPQMMDGIPIIPRGANANYIWPGQVGQSTTFYVLKIIKY